MLTAAGFERVEIETKENAAEIISGWMPGSGAEKYITSVYITAKKPASGGVRDDVRAGHGYADMAACCPPEEGQAADCGPGA